MDGTKMKTKAIVVQIACTLFIACHSAMISFSTAWSSYALKVLEKDDSPLGFSLTKYESTLVGSIPMLGSLLATPAAGYVCDSIGRKKSVILNSLYFVVAWSLILTARSFLQILIGRFLIGVGSGFTIAVNFVYISEITNLSIRGSATATICLMYNVGMLVSYLEGWFFSYNVICYISVSASVIYTLVACCIKDTPAYLLRIGQEKEALASLKFYRGETKTTEELIKEFAYIKSQRTNEKKDTDLTTDGTSNILRSLSNSSERVDLEKSSDAEKEKLQTEDGFVENEKNENPWRLLFTVDYNRRALISSVVMMVLNVSMGMIAVQAYAGVFFLQAAPKLSPDLCSVLLALVFVVSSCITLVVTNMMSRRFLMISTCIIASICMAALGSLLRWSWGPSWLAAVIIALFSLVFHMGCINIVFVQMSECFGPQVNSTATAIILCFMFAANFSVLSLYVPSVDYLGTDGTFFAFTAIGVITTVASIFFLKETRHEPLERVQKMFAQGYLYKKCDTL